MHRRLQDRIRSARIREGLRSIEYKLSATETAILLWGESAGLVSRRASTSRPYLEELDNGYVRPTVLKSLASIRCLLQQFKVYESRYGLKNDATLSLVNISGLREIDSRFSAQTSKNQKQESLKTATRWAVFDASKVKDTIEQLKSLVDGLVDVTDQLTRLRAVARSAGNRHPGLASMTSGIHIFETRDVRAMEIAGTPSICSRQIQALDLQGSADTFFSAQSFVSLSTQHHIDTFFSAQSLVSRPTRHHTGNVQGLAHQI
jgi:hypothetical protein